MNQHLLQPGDRVRLLWLPTGYSSSGLPLTVGHIYVFRYYDGSNVCTTTDVPNINGHYWKGRVEKVE